MNDHLELIDLLMKLEGHASTETIVKAYCKKYHMVPQLTYNYVVMSTLKNTIQVYYDREDNEWKFSQTPQFSYKSRLKDSGLDNPNNWHGDIRSKLLDMLEPLTEGTEYKIVENLTDKSSDIIELRKSDNPRIMGFWGKRDQSIRAFFNMDLYNSLRNQIKLPENERPKKTQSHVTINLITLWNVICIITNKMNYMEEEHESEYSEEFKKIFILPGVDMSLPRQKQYLDAAWKTWGVFHDKYVFSLRSSGKAEKGNNRSFKLFDRNGKHLFTIVVGLDKVTLYVSDSDNLDKSELEYENSNEGWRTDLKDIDECISELQKLG